MSDPAGVAGLSFDVEDWFHVENLRPAVPRETWSRQRLRVERNVDRLLELMEETGGIRATFFVLGWVAERCPGLVRRIARAGHEVASHGYGHELVPTLTPSELRRDVDASRAVLEDLAEQPVRGYRAPSFSITDWAVPILVEAGFEYDSSSFPASGHPRYGRLAAVGSGESVIELEPGFHEIGLSCLFVGPLGIPWSGGGYFRVLPYPLFRAGVRRVLDSRPFVFYLHPWEIDPGQPRVRGIPPLARFRHYAGLGRCEGKLRGLLADLPWRPLSELLPRPFAEAPAVAVAR
jgi:polysaccharide deacetylase family protein (PEP-CTERM system associated)